MKQKCQIVTVPDFAAAVARIAGLFSERQPIPPLIRLEGFCGAGKTIIGRALAEKLRAIHIEADRYANKYDEPPPYPMCIRQDELDHRIGEAIEGGSTVILDAVCLSDVAPVEKWGRGLVVYVKRLDFNNPDPMWHGGFHLEDEAPNDEPHRSVHLYHQRTRPHETADLIIEMPEEGHSLPKTGFSRHFCFDPA